MGLNLFPTIKQFSFGCPLQKQFVGLNCFDLTKCCFAFMMYCLTENVPKTLSKAPCLVAKRMSQTLHLLLFAQSM